MKIKSNFSLKRFNTFGIDVKAKQFLVIENIEELEQVLKRFYTEEIFILGGGSNMLLTQDIDKTVIYINTKGINIKKRTENKVIIDVEAGENWHEFVTWTVNHGFGGLENLSLIPGNVGTSPIQNIGAYGVELKDIFVSCEAIHRQTLELKIFSNQDCKFGYRQSVFKNELKGQYIISKIRFELTSKNHNIKTDYGAIQQELKKLNIENPKPKDVARAVINIRKSKLPNPKNIGNSGSFFKNPIVSVQKADQLIKAYPNIPFYKVDDNTIKIPAGWLIDQCGLKGYRQADAGVHEKQALVLVNYGQASGKEILALSKKIRQEVLNKFDIKLETEVNIF